MRPVSASAQYDLVSSHLWFSRKDLERLTGAGYKRTKLWYDDIKMEILRKGLKVFSGLLPRTEVLEYFELSLEDMAAAAAVEKQFGSIEVPAPAEV